MSKRHTATRRRAYGRRQHEIHERDDRAQDLFADTIDQPLMTATAARWQTPLPGGAMSGASLALRGLG